MMAVQLYCVFLLPPRFCERDVSNRKEVRLLVKGPRDFPQIVAVRSEILATTNVFHLLVPSSP